MSSPPTLPKSVCLVLLKTHSQPHDIYEEYFARPAPDETLSNSVIRPLFTTLFIPVLEHTHNRPALSRLAQSLRKGDLKQKYGGMIFTSQRAVEAWTDVVVNVPLSDDGARPKSSHQADPFVDLERLIPFPLYAVGPATERALTDLAQQYIQHPNSPYTKLNATIHGARTGNGAALASFILDHYNRIYREHWFTYFEAPRLPFVPLLGMSSENYGRKRLDPDDERLKKKALLFLVGEIRRDIIPRTLQEQKQTDCKIDVEEIEVYKTEVMKSFESNIADVTRRLSLENPGTINIIVVFSPQGADTMLKTTGYLDEQGMPSERAKRRWWKEKDSVPQERWIIVTIGPTTRDHLKEKLGIEPDVCSEKPSPEGLRRSIETFLADNNITNY